MKPLNGYKTATIIQGREKLPLGGYVLRIMGVKYENYDYGDKIALSFEIEEGEQKGFFAKDYRNQPGEDKKWRGVYRITVPKDDGSKDDEWKQNRFKTIMATFEESNPGFHWDWNEQKLKGLLIGGIFNDKEYDYNGRQGFYTNCHSLVTVEKIRSGDYKIPGPTMLKKKDDQDTGYAPSVYDSGFMTIPDDVNDESLPFN